MQQDDIAGGAMLEATERPDPIGFARRSVDDDEDITIMPDLRASQHHTSMGVIEFRATRLPHWFYTATSQRMCQGHRIKFRLRCTIYSMAWIQQ